MNVSGLPLVNATLNALSTVFILGGLWFIRGERKLAHIVCMVTALITSAAFLTCYITYHVAKAGVVTRFTHEGWPRSVYFFILATHTPLAIVVLPFILLTVSRALQARYDAHRRWARIAAPIWLYVSVTGVLIYLMLYVWFPPITVVAVAS
jgi:putative membrane protein